APQPQPTPQPQRQTPPPGYMPPQGYGDTPPQDPKGPKEKKKSSGSKLPLIIILIVAAVAIIGAVLFFVLRGRGSSKGESTDPNAGVYNAVTAEMWGIEMAIEDIWTSGFSIELKDGGKCVVLVDKSKDNGSWQLEGTAIHIKGGGLDSDGTLENGVLTLDNVLDMGITLVFEKEGYEAPTAMGDPDVDYPGATVAQDGDARLQNMWNGAWFGCIMVTEATGEFEDIRTGEFFDALIDVSVYDSDNGSYDVYFAGAEEAFAKVTCTTIETCLLANDVEFFGGLSVDDPGSWTLVQIPDTDGLATMNGRFTNNESSFEFVIFARIWGDSWEKEIKDGYYIPPSIDAYNAAIKNGELPPVGAAPAGYNGSGKTADFADWVEEPDMPDDVGEDNTELVTEPGEPTVSDGPPAGLEGPVDAYSYNDIYFVSYPTDGFFIDKDAILDTIAAKDASVKIAITPLLGEGDGEATIKRFDDCAKYEGYTSKDLTIAGYPSRMVTYKDDWGDYYANVYVDLGGNHGGVYGIKFTVSSAATMEDCTSETVMAILNTLTLNA
ncbi:MAG: hypothetical protein Q4B73_02585, partial [Lachnospiraceae bacterium]|nr:hypothetical protein [Lachnospiraceae bacterium]